MLRQLPGHELGRAERQSQFVTSMKRCQELFLALFITDFSLLEQRYVECFNQGLSEGHL
jgi:hypothetical protein